MTLDVIVGILFKIFDNIVENNYSFLKLELMMMDLIMIEYETNMIEYAPKICTETKKSLKPSLKTSVCDNTVSLGSFISLRTVVHLANKKPKFLN